MFKELRKLDKKDLEKIKEINEYWPSGIDGRDVVFDIPDEILRQKINEIIERLNRLSER